MGVQWGGLTPLIKAGVGQLTQLFPTAYWQNISDLTFPKSPATVCKCWSSKHIKLQQQFQHTIQWRITVAIFVIWNHKAEFLYFIHNNPVLLTSDLGRYPNHCLSRVVLSKRNWSNKSTRKSALLGWCGLVTQIGFYLRCCTYIPSLFCSRTVMNSKVSVATASTRL